MTPEQMLAREEIRYTLSVYNNAGDRGKIEELASAFLEDGVLVVNGVEHPGRQAIIEFLNGGMEERRAGGAKPTLVRHNLTTSRIEFVSETEANAWTYFIVFTDIGPDHAGMYIDRFKKSGERWLIAHRRVRVEWHSEHRRINQDD